MAEELEKIKYIKVNHNFTKTELAHILNALERWGERVKAGLEEMSDEAGKKGQVCLFAPSYADGIVRDLKIKLSITDKVKGSEIFKI